MSHIIYLVTNIANGSEYVGATKRGLAVRKKQHLHAAASNLIGCRVFNAAIRKYGEASFVWEILHDGLTQDEAMAIEIAEIASRKPRYNITAGGTGLRGMVRTPEWRAKMSAAMKGRPAHPNAIAALKANHAANPLRMAKRVLCIEEDRLFRSVNSASAHYGCLPSSISASMAMRDQTRAANKHFMLTDSVIGDDELRAALLAEIADYENIRRDRPRQAKCRAVMCINTGQIFESGTAAAKFFGISQMSVSLLCNKGGTTQGGLRFRFDGKEEVFRQNARTAEQYEAAKLSRIEKLRARRHPEETKARMREAAKKRGIAASTRSAQIKAASKPIRCIETGDIYPNVIEASKVLNIPHATIYAAIYSGSPIRKLGARFERVS